MILLIDMNFVRETFGNDTPVQPCFMHFKINCHDYMLAQRCFAKQMFVLFTVFYCD